MTRRPAFPPFEDLSSPREFFWVKHQPYLQSQGYMLRPRYHPDWRPSWIQKDGTNLKEKYSFLIFQDQHRSIYISTIIDAIRMEDGVKVVLRIVPVGSLELAMMMHLSSPKMPSDPRNHTVPVLGTIPIPGEENDRVFVISPVLRWFHSPDFHCRREFADAFRQILEGIDFMHENNIAHGGACTLNFLMDATNVCPKGFHIRHRQHRRTSPWTSSETTVPCAARQILYH